MRLSRPAPLGGPAGAGCPCNGFAVLHVVAAVPVHGHTIGSCLRTSVTDRDRRGSVVEKNDAQEDRY